MKNHPSEHDFDAMAIVDGVEPLNALTEEGMVFLTESYSAEAMTEDNDAPARVVHAGSILADDIYDAERRITGRHLGEVIVGVAQQPMPSEA